MFLVDLVHLVCLVHLVGLDISFVLLLDSKKPNKLNKQEKPNNDPIMGGISHEGKSARAIGGGLV
jgi:hypothetical protein